MVVRVCIDADHSPFVTSLAFPQGIAPGENIELYIGTWDLPANPPPKANTIVVDPLTKVVHVARTLESDSKRPSDSPLEPSRKRAFVIPNSGATTSNGTGKHKCGECGQFFSSIKEISIHMQQHLSSRIPQEKVSVVTLTHRPKDGSPPTKATITQDPSRSNIVEISIPATAVESFLNAVNDQAQQLLLKFAKPQAGNRLEIRKTEHQSEGDAFKKITMEALYEQDEPVARAPTPPSREIDAVERALEAIHAGPSGLSSLRRVQPEPSEQQQQQQQQLAPQQLELSVPVALEPSALQVAAVQENVRLPAQENARPPPEPALPAEPIEILDDEENSPPPIEHPVEELVPPRDDSEDSMEVPEPYQERGNEGEVPVGMNQVMMDQEVPGEIGSSSEAVAAAPMRHTQMEQPTSSADVDSTVGDQLPDDGGVDSTSHERRDGDAATNGYGARSSRDRQNHEAVSQSGQFERPQDVNAMMNMMDYGLQDEIQEPHSGMQ